MLPGYEKAPGGTLKGARILSAPACVVTFAGGAAAGFEGDIRKIL